MTTEATFAPLDREQLVDALAEADLRVLLMCVFHLSGDRRWLADPYRPRRDVRLIADREAGFAPEVQEEIVTAACAWLTAGPAEPAVDDPGPERFHEMMSVFLGETVPAEYVDLVRIEMGYDDGDAHWTARPADGRPSRQRTSRPVSPRSSRIIGA